MNSRILALYCSTALFSIVLALSQSGWAQEQATFTVTKTFDDGSNTEVEVLLTCNSGLPLVQSGWITPEYSWIFTVQELNISEPGTQCVITEESKLENYTVRYVANGIISDLSCSFRGGPGGNLSEQNSCAIENTTSPELRILGRKTWTTGNRHEYVVINFPGKTWEEASSDLSAFGSDFHLATITDQAEQDFVSDFLAENSAYGQWWLGGLQMPPDEPDASTGWTWITGEVWSYTNWQEGEPNDGGGCLCENHLATYVTSWNDEGSAIGSISGYVAESVDPVFADGFEN